MVSTTDLIKSASETLDQRAAEADRLARYYRAEQPMAFLSPQARKAIGDRLPALPSNVVRLAVDVLGERLAVQGFTDSGAWSLWTGNRMVTGSAQAHTDSLLFGAGYVSTWADPAGAPRIRVESPRQCVVVLDPATGEPQSALKRWWADGRGRALLFTRDTVTRLSTSSSQPRDAGLPSEGWEVEETVPNRLREVPITVLPNRPTTDRPLGESEATDVLPLADALAKLLQDMIVVSESHSRPRRWATGLEIPEEPVRDAEGRVVTDEHGEPVMVAVSPFGESPERVWQSESAETRFGEFPASGLGHFVEGTGVILRQISAVSAVPPSTLGLSQDQPASAEALRASEVNLVARARLRQATLGEGWARVARLALIIRDGVETPAARDVQPVWGDAESRSDIVAADRASKLSALGVPLAAVLDDLGWAPDKIAQVVAMKRAEAVDTLAASLAGTATGGGL